ncbi:MAG: RNase adapter protein RapZ [uncultured Solirubrobacteraceae bacterium]|uniref:RNase adapter protein RapZ n=1 Tax=uncultured Solirubrobacteraceae bacterium TaxID=1162706 RepID=A0A6J4SEC0_9ACTN|nr:MAG: RNase adapter protein RapZ [uncultured Solirubrobacteraceae bacterium]
MAPASPLEDLVVISGFSGAGKSTALNVFEDAGYFCVDNLPPEMIRALVEVFSHEGSKVERAAVVCDVRTGDLFEGLSEVLDGLAELDAPHRFVFLDAGEETLLTRYKETRRRHPLAPRGGVSKGIALERALLAPLKEKADLVIETDELKAAGLRRRITEELLPRQGTGRLAVTFQSFGFKHGPPRDADLAFDVRFLPNPHYVPDLKPLTGLDPRVVDYVGRDGRLGAFYEHLVPLLDYLMPQYVDEGKAHLVVAIGCTGGKHRSVAISEYLAARYRDSGDLFVDVVHRDIDKR